MKRAREVERGSERREKDEAGGRGRRRSVDVGNVRRIYFVHKESHVRRPAGTIESGLGSQTGHGGMIRRRKLDMKKDGTWWPCSRVHRR